LFFQKDSAKLGMSAKQCRERMADELARPAAQERAHARADVGDAVLGIDLPEPADAALLIFLKQQAGALALAANVSIHLQLVKCPTRDGRHPCDGHAEREQDR